MLSNTADQKVSRQPLAHSLSTRIRLLNDCGTGINFPESARYFRKLHRLREIHLSLSGRFWLTAALREGQLRVVLCRSTTPGLQVKSDANAGKVGCSWLVCGKANGWLTGMQLRTCMLTAIECIAPQVDRMHRVPVGVRVPEITTKKTPAIFATRSRNSSFMTVACYRTPY